MTHLLEGKVVAITGAARGLGRAYALDMAQRGAKVVVNDSGCSLGGAEEDPTLAQHVVDEIIALGGEAVSCVEDVSDFDAARRVIERGLEVYGQLDVLVNNAGILRDASIFEMRDEDWHSVIGVHLGGTFACSRAAADVMVDQEQGGAIINTVSIAGLLGNVGQVNYAAAKAGIFGLTRALALELSLQGVRVNAVAPVATTRMTTEAPFVPEGMRPELVAPLLSFLASDLAAQINGRIFGMHGDYLFEYAMGVSPGLRGDSWTPEHIAERFEAIAIDPTPCEEQRAPIVHAQAQHIKRLFEHLTVGFRARRARRWSARLLFDVMGCGRYTVRVRQGLCSVSEGRVGKPSSVIETDSETFWAIAKGDVDAQRAFIDGRMRVTELADMLKFQRVFDLKKVLGVITPL
ncbi:MAG: SDR family NAD(P)-dependent oxidoreductase [Deltaproteobacteria bacterium]|nr:SDR family NAD(P)-dependent oxidoreductase [Deltaproteobacteria bacterium]